MKTELLKQKRSEL